MHIKNELRQRLRKAIAEIPESEISVRSSQAVKLLCEQPEFRKAEVVMVFLSLAQEVDTTPIVLRCWQERKRVLAPKVSWNQRRMLPVEIRSLTDDLITSSLGIREPVSGLPFPIPLIDLVIVPGLGFDEFGGRLGRGQGFYDRFLANPEFRGISCGLVFEAQMTSNIPMGTLDQRVRMVVTDDRVRRFS